MKSQAVILHEFNSLESIKIEDHELEDLAEDMVEVRVQNCGVNFADFYTIHGLAGGKAPLVLGIECSGVVTQVGSDIVPFKIGDKVVCYDYKGGLHRSTVRVKHEKCFAVPEHIDLETAAAIFVNYLTAWFALFSLGNLKDGDSIFVSSCAGGVGLAIVELIKSKKNIKMYGTASSSKRSFLEGKGVQFVEYDQLANLKETFDVVVESMSTDTRNVLMPKLKPFGMLVIIGAKDLIGGSNSGDPSVNPLGLIFGNSAVAGLHIGVLADNYPALINEALDAIFTQIVPENIPRQLHPFKDAKHAYEELANRRNIGKILLQL